MDAHGWVNLISIANSGAFGYRIVTEADCLKAIAYDDRFGRARLVTRQLEDKTWQVRSVDSENREVAALINPTREKVHDINDHRLDGQRYVYHGLKNIEQGLVNQIAATGIDMYWSKQDAAHPTAVLSPEELHYTNSGYVCIDLQKYLEAGYTALYTEARTKKGRPTLVLTGQDYVSGVGLEAATYTRIPRRMMVSIWSRNGRKEW